VGLEAQGQAPMLALRRDGESRQGREPVMHGVVGDEGRMPFGGPGAAAGRDAPKAALIQEGQVGSQAAGLF
jgi:hypothetical protein